jgi:hypothetical protein
LLLLHHVSTPRAEEALPRAEAPSKLAQRVVLAGAALRSR